MASHNKKPQTAPTSCVCATYFLCLYYNSFFSFILGRFAHYDLIKICGREIRRSYCLKVTKPELFYAFDSTSFR